MILSDLWSWEGEIERGPYLLSGTVLFFIKHNLDRYVYYSFYHQRTWRFADYLQPFGHIGQRPLSPTDVSFFTAIFLLAIPFIYAGISLTIKRLRAVKLPLWLVVFFFVPLVNVLFFLILCVLPSLKTGHPLALASQATTVLDKIIPVSPLGSAVAAVLMASILAFLGVCLGVTVLRNYGVSLFVAGPFSLGLVASLLHGYHGPKSFGSCLGVASLSIFILGLILVGFALEGFMCILMALPIGLAMAAFGAFLGYFIQRRPNAGHDAAKIVSMMVLILPLLMGAEYAVQAQPALFAVKSYVDINAPAEIVWKNVIAFPPLPVPQDILFKAGIAYPTHATIEGKGVGALRRCYFTTGTFVEPITIWDENRLLRFNVTAQPPPMKELSPYKDIHPPHLDNYLVSRQGQFLLSRLADGKLRLEGTTWYQNNMWPQPYWRLWSDHIIHEIHLQVLNHIKDISERHF
jgi:uncharacterized membrane protein YhaH (DUF805 family)